MKRYSFLILLAVLTACMPQGKRQQQAIVASAANAASSPSSRTAANDDALLTVQVTRGTLPQQLLRREGYICNYNNDTRTPNYCAWVLTRSHVTGKEKRGGIKFQPDMDVPEPRADTYDYSRSGYDRGHICPAGDNKWSHTAMEQSFLLSNICPQAPELNRGDWNEIEQSCREWARRYGKIYIIAGPIFLNQRHRRIGKHKVAVPEAFFKVVLCLEGQPKAIGFICRNTGGNRKKDAYVNTLAQVERITGYRFFPTLPAKMRQAIETTVDLSDW